jgi:glycosyltransferase involved in cell wall biosynthesis
MKRKIIYYVQQYNPKFEAISKEIEILHNKFPSMIYNPQDKKMRFTKKHISFNYKHFPFPLAAIPLRGNKKIAHIYTSLGNRLYLTMVRKKPILLTGAGSASEEKINKCIKHYKKVSHITVESEKDRDFLFSKGFDDNKVSLVYPGIDLSRFNYSKPDDNFSILFASSPMQKQHFHSRGVNFLLENFNECNKTKLILLWRKKYIEEIKSLIKGHNNIKLINEFIPNIEDLYNSTHATIFPSLTYLDNKPCPHSIIESLASGKPVAVSSASGIAPLVKKEKCGVVFDTEKESFVKAMELLTKEYTHFQSKARKTAEKYFSKELFIKQYANIYDRI